MKPSTTLKPSLAKNGANFDLDALLANAPDNVQKADNEPDFIWDNALVSHNYTDLKNQLSTTIPNKQPITIRLDSDILSAFKATGKGWQTRINETLRQSLKNQGKLA